ncbi:hypothetical protein A2U01_0081545 [Trifolium medium]|uniref:Uncharacterized protein n=1 Tax=Trifolium medium TaxID=97028 RepID=A0A392TJA2_9FABA|nr:hypothetical protein [Trifolium medium]
MLAQRAYQRAWSLYVATASNFQMFARVLSLDLAQRARQDMILCFGYLKALRASMGS